MNRAERWWLAACCWLGAVARFRGLFANSFHPDEALFAGWARLIAVWRDPLLWTQAVDKPPLLFYLQALFYPLFGPVEWAARMPSFIVSLLLIPLTAQAARRLTGDKAAAIVTAVVMALAPLTIQFSATAFSDPLLTFWLMAALYTVIRPITTSRHRSAAAVLPGVLFGLALATKYQALLFLPLLMGMGWIFDRRRREGWGGLVGLAMVLALLLLWQGLRPASAGLVGLQWANIGGLRPARSWELWPRLLQTVQVWRLSLDGPLAAAFVAVAIGVLVGIRRGRFRWPAAEIFVLLFVSGYVLLHWLWAVPIWDRYLLPIFPLAVILFGRGFSRLLLALYERRPHRYAYLVALTLLTLILIPTALAARAGRFPIGGRPDADGGAAESALLLKDAPYGTVLYDHWYSWHWAYQLFDSGVYVSWFPQADALLDDLTVFAGRGPQRYIALPSSAEAAPLRRRLSAAGFDLEALDGQDKTATMTLYRIIAPETVR
ncbi:MAG: glycosyltransferase family 39 protein [Candidatus Promineofilum sp.]|nr:glycosyltransferase family 39 protein [Promineifilum sp.]